MGVLKVFFSSCKQLGEFQEYYLHGIKDIMALAALLNRRDYMVDVI